MFTLYLLAVLTGFRRGLASAATDTVEVRQMYMLYALEFDLGEYMIITRNTPAPFPLCGTESAWIVPGTVSEDD